MTRTVFHGGELFDGTGSPPAAADVVIEDGRIMDVGGDLDGDVGVDCSGKVLLPGMFDCHVHLGLDLEDFDLVTTMNLPLTRRILRFPEAAMRPSAARV